jgi:hypothetical protein
MNLWIYEGKLNLHLIPEIEMFELSDEFND